MSEKMRFYDFDPDFRAFMTLFERLDDSVQEEIAQDIIINIARYVNKNNDFSLNNIKPEKEYKRWYDASPAVHTAIEELKKLDKKTRDEMIASVSDIFFMQGKDL